MKAVKFSEHSPTFHWSQNSDCTVIYIPEKKTLIYEENSGSWTHPSYGFNTRKESIKLGELIFNGGNPTETEEQYQKRNKKEAEEFVKKCEQYNNEHPGSAGMYNENTRAIRKPEYSDIEFIDIEIEDFDKLVQIFNDQEYLKKRLKEILGS